MKDVLKSIRDAYYSSLSSVTFDGDDVTVYEVPPRTGQTNPFILLSIQTDTDGDSSKCNYGHNTTILIEVVNDFDGDYGSKDNVDTLSDDVLGTIVKGNSIDLLPTFNVITSTLDSVTYLDEYIEDIYRIRKQIRIRHRIEETT